VLSTLLAAVHIVDEEELVGFIAGATQLQQQYVKPPALFVEGAAPKKGSMAAAANHLGSRKASSRTGHALKVYKNGRVTKPRAAKLPDFPKEKKKLKRKVFESMADMAAALHPPFAGKG
jgi:hypothetical protein